MPALPFQPHLKNPVRNGSKPGTVRQVRLKNPIKRGDTLYMFTGMRTKQCKKFGERICRAVFTIKIDAEQKEIWLDGINLFPILRKYFAETDIHGTEQQFFDFFKKAKYTRPLVWIVWEQNEVDIWNHFIKDIKTSPSYIVTEAERVTRL